MQKQDSSPKNMRTFWVIWGGQLISVLGSGLTSFAMGVWIYDQTGKATPFALTALFATLPSVLLMPFAGAVADRFNRRKVMILADSGDALVTIIAAGLLFFGDLQVWHIYLLAVFGALFSTFQGPAYMASTTMLVPKKDLARAGGIMQMGQAIQSILTPLVAGGLYALIGLRGVLLIDAVTYLFAVGALLVVRIPQPERVSEEVEEGEGAKSLWGDAIFGWRYLRARPGLFGMLLYFASVNFFLSFSGVLSGPLVLSFGTATDLGVVQTAGGVAMLIGSVTMGAWGGPKRKVPALIGFIALASTGFLIAGIRASTVTIAAGTFILLAFIPFASALSQAVFQTKVPPDLQGRVFAIRGMIARSISPLAMLVSGPLADRVFEPLMSAGGGLSSTFLASWLGVGPGRGIGLMFAISCLFLWGESLIAIAHPRIRQVEREIPDAIPDEVDEIPPDPTDEGIAPAETLARSAAD
jgi:MFS family permease